MGLVFSLSASMAVAQEASAPAEPDIRYGQGDYVRSGETQGYRGPDRLAEPVSAAFRNAEIETVVNQIIGGALGIDYTVANDVRGQVTLRMNAVETRSGVIRQLRDVLAAAGVSRATPPTP